MKILHTEASCGWGGQELRILNEAAGMVRRGHEILIAAPMRSRIYAEAKRRGLDARALPIERKSFAGFFAMRALLKSEQVQVVNTHSSTDSWLAALACLSMRAGPAVVRTRHISAPIPGNAGTRWLYTRAASVVVTTGEALRQQVIKETGADPSRVLSVPSGVNLEQFRPGDRRAARTRLGLNPDGFVVGIVATLRSWKGHRFLLDALLKVPDPNIRVVIVGSGPGESNLSRQIEDLGLSARVTMAGQQEDVVPWLQSFDVFALPSYANEGVPQAIMQAMAVGLPVITTAVGAISEVARENVTAVVVPSKDADALAAAIIRLSEDTSLCRRLGDAALIEARERFADAVMLDAMETVFKKVAGSLA